VRGQSRAGAGITLPGVPGKAHHHNHHHEHYPHGPRVPFELQFDSPRGLFLQNRHILSCFEELHLPGVVNRCVVRCEIPCFQIQEAHWTMDDVASEVAFRAVRCIIDSWWLKAILVVNPSPHRRQMNIEAMIMHSQGQNEVTCFR